MLPSSSAARLPRVAAAVAVAVLTLLLLAAGRAEADSIMIQALDPAGRNDFVSEVPRSFVVSGVSAGPASIFIKYRSPGPTPCAASAAADSGEWWDRGRRAIGLVYGEAGLDNPSVGTPVNGAFSFTDVYASELRGPQMLCTWIAASASSVASPVSQIVHFRPSGGTITVTLDTASPRPGAPLSMTVGGASEAPKEVFASYRPAGTPCAASFNADDGTSLLLGTSVNGAFSIDSELSVREAGHYVLCAWLAGWGGDAEPAAGPYALPFTVAAASRPQSSACVTARAGWHRARRRVARMESARWRVIGRAERRRLERRLAQRRHALRLAAGRVRRAC
jgi:hypothetical protein